MTQAKVVRRPMGNRMRGGEVIKNPGAVFFRLMKYIMKDYGIALVLVVLFIIASVLANVQGTLFLQTLIDDYILPMLGQENPDFTNLLHAIFRVGCFYLAGVLCTFAYSRIMVNATQGTLRNLRNDLFAHMEKLPIKYFDTHAHGDIMSIYTNDIDTLRQMISQSIPQIISSAVTVVSVFISMISLNVVLTLVTLLMVGIMLVTARKVSGLSGRYFVKQQTDIGKVNGYIEEMMEGQKVVKVFCHEEKSLDGFKELNNRLFDSAYNANLFAL